MRTILIHVALLFCTLSICSAEDILSSHHQLIVVTTQDWNNVQGTVQLFERMDDHGSWKAVGSSMDAVVGKSGLAWGIGIHPNQNGQAMKIEGDRKSPAGIFPIGPVFGLASAPEIPNLHIEYLPLTPTTEAVDDPQSTHYNTIVDSTTCTADWKSSEMMGLEPLYRLGFVINHNCPNQRPGAGSAIFFHIWRSSVSGTYGCTATSFENISTILSWLDQRKKPVVLQLPITAYSEWMREWHLPKLAFFDQYKMVDVAHIIPPIVLDIRYATTNNFMGFQIYQKSAFIYAKRFLAPSERPRKSLQPCAFP